MIGMKSNNNEFYTLDNVYVSAEIAAYGIQYLQSLNPTSTQNIHVSGNGNNVSQSSFDNSRDISIKQAINPADQPNKKNEIISFIEKFWWTVAIPLIIGLILIAIEHNFFKSEYMMFLNFTQNK